MMFGKLKHNLFICFALIIVAGCVSVANYVQAETATKEQIQQITPNESSHDPVALEIAKTIKPDFFALTPENTKTHYYARFLPLDMNEPKRFLAFTANDISYYCTNHGCPIYIYENTGSAWKLVLSLQAFSILHDTNTPATRPNDIISKNSYVGPVTYIWSAKEEFYKTKGQDE